MKQFTILIVLAVFSSLNASAADAKKIQCVFIDEVGGMKSESNYVDQYAVNGSVADTEASLSVKHTEFGVAKIGEKYVVDRSNVHDKDVIDVPYRKFAVSSKNKNPNWKTYVAKTPVNDGYIAAVSLTLSNLKVSGENYGNSYKAVLSMTTLGDDSNYTEKLPGFCSVRE